VKYKAHDYQAYATNFILEHPISAVFLDMGLGKSIITLSAIFDLCLDSFLVRKVLVIAPLRVARDTWPAEIHKWDHLHGLTYSVAVAKRFRTLLKVRPGIKRIVGLTGTPSSNGLMDLWAEFRILDI